MISSVVGCCSGQCLNNRNLVGGRLLFWSMVGFFHSHWSVVGGFSDRWSMVPLVGGRWSVVPGRWSVVSLWSVVCGWWLVGGRWFCTTPVMTAYPEAGTLSTKTDAFSGNVF